jgi:hypothetical protein
MTSFSDVANSLAEPSCCMRKNPTPTQQLKDDLTMLGISFGLYLVSYLMGFHSLCLMSLASMNMITFQAGISFHKLQNAAIHLNQFDELDVSTSSESSESSESSDGPVEELSLKQREQGATLSKPMSVEQEDKLNQQLSRVVEETNLRNRKRSALSTARTPSCTTLNDEGTGSDDSDMPPLIPVTEANPRVRTTMWTDVPNYSQTHYLYGCMDEVD